MTTPEAPDPPDTDWRTGEVRPLVPPSTLRQELPLAPDVRRTVLDGRRAAAAVLGLEDDRLLVVVGPCSLHDRAATLDYARRLAGLAARRADELVILMRAYVEKPRTALGWRGLVTDPGLDGSHRWEDGLVVARALLRDIAALGLPLACEFLDPLAVPYLVDLVSWGCIGARTTESQVHRQLASGLALPVGFKNPTGGNVQAAVDAVRAVARPQVLLGIGDDGRACAGVTGGNPDAHVVLRGGTAGPNADRAGVADALRRLDRAGLVPAVVVDASHGNSERDHRRQPRVAADIGERLAAGEPGLAGVMLESFLVAGRQDPDGVAPAHLVYGQSVTDACMGWTTTVEVVDGLARAVDRRRRAGQAVGVHGSIHGEAGHPSAADMMEKAVAPSMDWRMTSA